MSFLLCVPFWDSLVIRQCVPSLCSHTYPYYRPSSHCTVIPASCACEKCYSCDSPLILGGGRGRVAMVSSTQSTKTKSKGGGRGNCPPRKIWELLWEEGMDDGQAKQCRDIHRWAGHPPLLSCLLSSWRKLGEELWRNVPSGNPSSLWVLVFWGDRPPELI